MLQVVVSSLEDHLPLDYCCVCLYDAVDHVLTVECVGARGQALGARARSGREGARFAWTCNGLAKCVRGQLVYEPDIDGAPTAVRAAAVARRHPLVRRRAARRGEQRLRRADRRAPRARGLQQRRLRVPAPAQRARGAGRAPGAAPHGAAARLRRPAPDAAGGDAAGAAEGARPDGQRHRPRHQQRHLAGGALHRVAARDRARPERARARLPRDDPARQRGRGADRGAHARVLPAAGSGAGAEPGQPERGGAGRHRAHARALERHAAGARRGDRARHVADGQRSGGAGRRSPSCARRSPTWCSTPWTPCRRAAR